MKLPSLRVSNNIREIAQIFKECYTNNKEIMIWQTTPQKRIVTHAIIETLDLKERFVILIPSNKDKFTFDPNITLYLRSNHKSILFKCLNADIENSIIFIPFPKEVRLIENRAIPRINLSQRADVTVTFNSSSEYQTSQASEHTCRVIDLSKKGISFLLTNKNRHFFIETDKILISRILDKKIEPRVHGTIAYIRPLHQKGKSTAQLYRAGVKFDFDIKLPF